MAKANPRITPPVDEHDVSRFLKEVAEHPDSKELLYRMRGFEAEVRARGVNDIRLWSRLRHGWEGFFAEKRSKIHDKIIRKLLMQGSKAKSEHPAAVTLLGCPGSGKTSLALPFAEQWLGKRLSPINPDDVKELLPEYEGWNATPLHDESAWVAEQRLRERAQEGRYNVVYDIVGRDTPKVVEAINRFESYGYDIYLVLADLPSWQACSRAWDRFQTNPFNRNHGNPGRYVPPDYVYGVGDASKKTFEAVRGLPAVKGWCHLDAAAPRGTGPHIVDSVGWP